MKNIWKIALLVAALMTSCNQPIEEGITPEQNSGNAIEFYVGNANRTTYFEDGLGIHWKAGDKISVRRFDASNASDYRQRANFTVDNSGASSTLTQVPQTNTGWHDISWLEDQDTYISAFYPATNNGSIQSVAISLPSAQTQAAAGDHSHIGGLMVMKTEPMKFSAPYPSSVGLEFRNMYSIIELTLKGTQSRDISYVSLSSKTTGLTINGSVNADLYTSFEEDDANGIKGLSASNTLTNVTTTLTEPAALTAEGVKVYFVVLPGAHESGDITVMVRALNGSTATVTMDKVTFKANNVYRPVVNLTFDELEENVTVASIKHTFSDDKPYSDPIAMMEGVKPILDRDYGIYNIPMEAANLKIATINASSYPTINKIEALTAGNVYVMLGNSKLVTNNIHTSVINAGWEAITPATDSKTYSDFAKGQIYYTNTPCVAEVSGTWTIYKRYMAAGEEYDLTALSALLGGGFQGVRPIAAEITNEVIPAPVPAGATVYMDFTSQPQNDRWTTQSSFNNILLNSIKGKIEMSVESTLTDKIELDFSYIIGTLKDDGKPNTDYAGSGYHKEKYLLMDMNSTTNALSIGFPAMVGYKLTAVELTPYSGASSSVKPKVCISSTAAPADAVSVSGAFVQWVHTSGNLTLNIENSQANTPYYLYALGGYSSVRLHGITLYYEPVQ